MLNVITRSYVQDKILKAFEELRETSQAFRQIDREMKEHKERMEELKPTRDALLRERSQKKKLAYSLIRDFPEVSGDLIERIMDLAYEYRDQ